MEGQEHRNTEASRRGYRPGPPPSQRESGSGKPNLVSQLYKHMRPAKIACQATGHIARL